MKIANLFLTLSIAAYFTIGSYESIIWSDFYYTVVFGYMFCCLLIDKKHYIDKLVGLFIAGGIWLLYLVRPLIFYTVFYAWIRFSFGCLIWIFGIFYLTYVIVCSKKEPYNYV